MTVSLTAAQISDARRGRAVSKVLPTDSARDVTVFGIIGVRMSRAAYVARMRDVRNVVAGRSVTFGIFHDPAIPSDVEPLSVDSSEYEELRSCTPNDCAHKLPESGMRRFADSVDWNGPDPKGQIEATVREGLLRFVTNYRAIGNATMVRYDDRGSVQSSDAFVALLAQSRFMRDYAPELRNYLISYPAGKPDGAEDVIYWSTLQLPRLRPTFTLSHVVVYIPAAGTPLVARKQIYANHYFEAAFELLAVLDAPSPAGDPLIYLVSVRRYRFDNLPRRPINIRARVQDAMVGLVRADLERERDASVAR